MSIWSHISKILESLVIGETLSALFNRLNTPPEKRVGFTIAAIALSAKMAKADGVVTNQEKLAFKKIFTILPGDEKYVQYVFQLAQKDIAGFEIYAKKISKMLKNKPILLENLIEGLLYISIADKIFHPDEENFINKVSKIFQIPSQKLNILKSRYIPEFQEDPYLVLGLTPDLEFKDMKKKWQRLVHQSHPDNMIAQGLPQEAINLATSRLIVINKAWDKINQNSKQLQIIQN